MRLRIFLIGLIVVVLLGVGVAWLERAPLLTWYYLHGLAAASDENRQTWVERVATLDSAAVPGLIERLRQADLRTCSNVAAALTHLVESWEAGDARRLELAAKLADACSTHSAAGQLGIMDVQSILLQTSLHDPSFS